MVGPGGIGKTRLAIEAASQSQAAFSDGVYFVRLDSVNTVPRIVPEIADALGFAFENERRVDPKIQLFNYLREKQALLVLDNLEQLLAEPGIEVLGELLTNAPKVKLLTTSRESLELRGEWLFEVEGLPGPERLGTQENIQDTSVELFFQRARRAHAGFKAAPTEYPTIARICQLVEGMPLGIELAAAWVRTLSCEQIVEEIERGLEFLTGSTRDFPTRHRSMRAVFDHSWTLLSVDEQAVLLGLSAFRGGFKREAAEQVAGATLPLLSSLVMKSLIRRNGAERYGLHELIRQFAAEHLSDRPKEQRAIRTRHSQYYLEYFGQADARLRSSTQQETLTELTAEMDNFRVAWDWAITQGRFTLIEKTMRTFEMFYDIRGWLQEGFDRLEGALRELGAACEKSPADREAQVALAHILTARSLFAYRLAWHGEAQRMLEQSLEILRPLNEPQVLLESVTLLGMVMKVTGNYQEAMQRYGEGLKIAIAINDRWFVAFCLTLLAELASITQVGNLDNRHERMQAAVAAWRAIGDPRFTTMGLNLLSLNAAALGRHSEAHAALEECVALSMSIEDRLGLSFAYRGLGLLAEEQGLHMEAVKMLHASLDTFAELGARQEVAQVLSEMGRSAFALGNDTEARRVWRESLRIATETHGASVALEALVGFARLQAKQGDINQALETLLIVLNHPACLQQTKDRALQLRAEFERQVTSRQVEAAAKRVEENTFEAAIDEALKS